LELRPSSIGEIEPRGCGGGRVDPTCAYGLAPEK
jgi:hypothetical protein